MNEPRPPSTTRRRLPLWGGILALVLLFPAVVIPLLLASFREPAFASIDEIDLARVTSMEIFVLNRPDGGPDIGGTRGLFAIPVADFDRALAPLRKADPIAAESPRGIWLGRLVVKLADGRSQTVMLHRPKGEYDRATVQRLELRIGRHQFAGPPVGEFVTRIAEIAGLPAKP